MKDTWAVPSESMQWIYLGTRQKDGKNNEREPINTRAINEQKTVNQVKGKNSRLFNGRYNVRNVFQKTVWFVQEKKVRIGRVNTPHGMQVHYEALSVKAIAFKQIVLYRIYNINV